MSFQTIVLVYVLNHVLLLAAGGSFMSIEGEICGLAALGKENIFSMDMNQNEENSTEILVDYVGLNKASLSMFNTGSGLDLVEYLREKLDEEEVESFKHDKLLIDAAIIEYHKYLELTRMWINADKNNRYVYIPSKLIDIVWHWHILQTYEYYLMCNQQFNGIFLHHRPYFGKEKQSKTFKLRTNKYKKTLLDYIDYFGDYPPSKIWGNIHKYSIGSCDEMHSCDSHMNINENGVGDCDEMHDCDSHMSQNVGDCDEMHDCDSHMSQNVGDCDEMHDCDSYMEMNENIGSCDEMHACDSYMSDNNVGDCDEMHDCDSYMQMKIM